MNVVRVSQVAKEPVTSPMFTSANVTRQPLSPSESQYSVAMVTFGKGVRNKLHTHTSDQVLIVTSGKGLVATEKEQRDVTVGDVVFFPTGEKHWHGAAKDSEFAHIFVYMAGTKSTQVGQ